MVHADFMTHRVFSRNGRSSRAVPVLTLLKEEPYVPHFMMNEPGMVATQEFDADTLKEIQAEWLELANITKEYVKRWSEKKVHKQWANRPLEWFGYIDVLLTTTEIANFMALRDEAGAQPEIQDIATAIKESLEASTPTELAVGDWHLPYVSQEEHDLYNIKVLQKLSTARCARLTIRPFDGDGSIPKEIERYEKLMVSRPVHASPAEHIATPDQLFQRGDDEYYWGNQRQHGNFYGWRQFRKMIPDNTINDR